MQTESSPPSDEEIVRQVLDGNVNAFEILLNRYKPLVFGVARRHVPISETEEMAQEIVIRAYQSLPNFKGRGSFKKWLSAIATRACCDFWRKRYRSRENPMSSLSDDHREWLERVLADQSGASFEEQTGRQEAREVLDWAMGHLSPEERIIIELVYLEGRTGREAAEMTGWSVANVKIRSYRARKKLQKLLTTAMEAEA